jgi:hypothetical protein
MRTLEYMDVDSNWLPVEWPTVVSGMVVRMFEDDGTPITDGTGVYEMQVVSDAYQQTISGVGDIWTIDVNDPDPMPYARRQE